MFKEPNFFMNLKRHEKVEMPGIILPLVIILTFMIVTPATLKAQTCTSFDYNISTIAAGVESTVALKEDGTVVAVGVYYSGVWDVPNWSDIKEVAAGAQYMVGLKENGTVVTGGMHWYLQPHISTWTDIKDIVSGYGHVVGLKEDGTVVGVGDNYFGQLDGISAWTDIKAIAAGCNHTIGLKTDGTVVAVGDNSLGQLDVSDWTDIKAIAAGCLHTVGLKSDGTVVAVGDNWSGQLNVYSWAGIKAISTGLSHTVGLKEDGTVVGVGNNYFGQLNINNWTGITAIAAGPHHTVGLKADGTVVAAGHNNYGQLNVGNWTDIRQPYCANQIPTANAGSDQMIECARPSGASVMLDGSGSTDPDGDPLTYTWTWAGGSAEGVNPTVQLPLGTTVVTLTVSDGKATATDTVSITVRDSTPPVTAATGGNGDWYNTNVISTFTTFDICSGVKEVHYIVNGHETVIPGGYAATTLTDDGIYNISYFAVDNAGNMESPKGMTVKIDKTPPTVNLSASPNILWPPNHKMVNVFIGGEASDATSSLASIVFTVTDEYGTVQPTISGFNTTVPLEAWREGTDKDGRTYSITAVAKDVAGNKTTTSVTVSVPHDQGN